MERIERNLHEVARDIRTADLLMFRGQSWVSRLIGTAGRSEYSHAAMADRLSCGNGTPGQSDAHCGDEIYCTEVREGVGGRIVTLASQVRKYPGQIDVWALGRSGYYNFDPYGAAALMRKFAGQDYGWWSVAQAAMQHVAFVRLGRKHNYDLERDLYDRPPFCSEAVSYACREGGGQDPAAGLADRYTLPGDLVRNAMLTQYLFTLAGV